MYKKYFNLIRNSFLIGFFSGYLALIFVQAITFEKNIFEPWRVGFSAGSIFAAAGLFICLLHKIYYESKNIKRRY